MNDLPLEKIDYTLYMVAKVSVIIVAISVFIVFLKQNKEYSRMSYLLDDLEEEIKKRKAIN